MKNCEDLSGGAGKAASRATPSRASAQTGVRKKLRRLKWNEVVTRGDFVHDERNTLALWEGPTGFRADAFVKPIYRRGKAPAVMTKK